MELVPTFNGLILVICEPSPTNPTPAVICWFPRKAVFTVRLPPTYPLSATVSIYPGVVVPIPTFPADVITACTVPSALVNLIESL